MGCWTLRFCVGTDGIVAGGGLRLSTDSDSDWEELQFHLPTAPGFTTISTTGQARLSWLLSGGFLGQRLDISVHGAALVEGDEVRVVIGDRSRGGPGVRAQTFAEEQRRFLIEVDARGDGVYLPLPQAPTLRVVGGPVARLSLVVPSQVVVGEPFALTLRALDRHGNSSHGYRGEIQLAAEGEALSLPPRCSLEAADRGVRRLEGLVAHAPGLYRIDARDPDGRAARSNPLQVLERPGAARLLWGDLHGQVRSADKLAAYFGFARDVAALDFAAHQRNDHEISAAHWAETQRAVRTFNAPGRFAAFLGYEWSGPHERGGDRNLYYLDDDRPLRRSGHDRVDDESDLDTDLPHIRDVYAALRGQRAFLVPHVGGRPANLAFHDAELEPVIEVCSTHGTFEWFLRDALQRGLRVGFIAGSDDYKLRLGCARPGIGDRRFSRGGLAAVLARSREREAIHAALQARSCYATSGERIILEVLVDEHAMGEAYEASAPPRIEVRVSGTAAIERVELFRGLDLVHSHRPAAGVDSDGRVKITWGGSSRAWPYSGVLWEGTLQVEGGALREVDPLPLDRGDEEIQVLDHALLRFRTFTAGDVDGVRFATDEGALLRLELTSTPTECVLGRVSAPMSQVERAVVTFSAAELARAPRVVEVGPVERRVCLYRIPATPAPADTAFSLVDDGAGEGLHPYWVRVEQEDGELAWSSPVYVTRRR